MEINNTLTEKQCIAIQELEYGIRSTGIDLVFNDYYSEPEDLLNKYIYEDYSDFKLLFSSFVGDPFSGDQSFSFYLLLEKEGSCYSVLFIHDLYEGSKVSVECINDVIKTNNLRLVKTSSKFH